MLKIELLVAGAFSATNKQTHLDEVVAQVMEHFPEVSRDDIIGHLKSMSFNISDDGLITSDLTFSDGQVKCVITIESGHETLEKIELAVKDSEMLNTRATKIDSPDESLKFNVSSLAAYYFVRKLALEIDDKV